MTEASPISLGARLVMLPISRDEFAAFGERPAPPLSTPLRRRGKNLLLSMYSSATGEPHKTERAAVGSRAEAEDGGEGLLDGGDQ